MEFTGTVSRKELASHNFVPTNGKWSQDSSGNWNYQQDDAIPVTFQFILSADRNSFEMGHIDMTPFNTSRIVEMDCYPVPCKVQKLSDASQQAILNFIYQ